MKSLWYKVLVALSCFVIANISYGQKGDNSLKVVLIRHGEKPDKGENLSCTGLNRAIQLSQVLSTKFGTPGHIYVPSLSLGKSTSAGRMYQTIIPFAVKYNLSINTNYDEKDAKDLAKTILDKKGTVLVVWEHHAIPAIVEHLGVKNKDLKWSDDDFDSIWIVTYQNGKANLTTDHEHINPSKDCR